MVCRDASTHKARRVPALDLRTNEQRALFALGEERKDKKRISSLAALDRVPPTTAEVAQLHNLMLETKAAEDGAPVERTNGPTLVPMSKTQVGLNRHQK